MTELISTSVCHVYKMQFEWLRHKLSTLFFIFYITKIIQVFLYFLNIYYNCKIKYVIIFDGAGKLIYRLKMFCLMKVVKDNDHL